MRIKAPLVFLLICISVRGDDEAIHQTYQPKENGPWFTGPLLAPSGYTTPPGQYNVEPYLYYKVDTGFYDSHGHPRSTPHLTSVRIQVPIKIGIMNRIDCQFSPQGFYREKQGEHSINIGDLPFSLGFQLLPAKISDPWPGIKLALKAVAPVGKYQKLNPSKEGTDAIGRGSWFPGASLTLAKLWDAGEGHFVEGRLAINYQFGTPLHVKGFNAYGGGPGTNGTIYPGNFFWIDSSIQYNLSQNWALACDLLFEHRNKDRFTGKGGEGNPSKEQLSIAPALEYNWSKNIGVIGGVWLTLSGRNTSQFMSGVIAINIHI
jgi:hypothetical protein